MDSLGFKFTFYQAPIDEKVENSEEKVFKKVNTARQPSQPRPILAQIINQPNFRISRPSTEKKPKASLKPLSTSRSSMTPSDSHLPRSKSYLRQTKKECRKIPQSKGPQSCNILKLLPIIHHHKKPRGLIDYIEVVSKQRFGQIL
ncbi:hypothetical protein SteCoe_19059 [Stentor coeruleus]|uniref:Uncharacterized protein n=1 Tax=Stentor coeruleus TaxID=5963 RepID=A0A1R2BV00_9CILI|nr:hypothetical protein SteCoe_19059 [Stentor coeruleus]